MPDTPQAAASSADIVNAIRALAMDAVQKANSGHPGMPMGMAEIAEVLWRGFLRHNPKNPAWPDRDRFVLSNGHGSMLQYALLHLTGYDLPMEELRRFRQLHSRTPGHPEVGYTPGVETTTGPLGQGLANAVGFALAERLMAAEFNRPGHEIVDHHTYVFCGDGCLMEGISHEACSLAGILGLGKLVAVYDDNGISIDGHVEGWFRDDTPKRFQAYGWNVVPDVKGHDTDAVRAAFEQARANASTGRPTLICCKTVIGKGSPHKAGTEEAHGAALGEKEVAETREAIGWKYVPRADELKIEAESKVGGNDVIVSLGEASAAAMPESILRYVIRTRESVILDDASSGNAFSADPYLRENRVRSILCLPLLHQSKLSGALYLENNLAPRVFSSGRITVLKVLVSQAAISIENTRLYRDLEDREAKLKQAYLHFSEAQRLSKTGSFISDLLVDEHIWSAELRRICEFDPDAKITVQMVRDVIHPDDAQQYEAAVARGMTGQDVDFDFRVITPRGVVKHLRGIAHVTELVAGRPLFSGAIQDVTEIKAAEEALNKARSELAHVTRMTTLNALAASIAHEVNQPLSGILSNAGASLRFLAGDAPDLEEVREAVRDIVRDGKRAGEIIARIRGLTKKTAVPREKLDLNETISEVLALISDEAKRNSVIVRTKFADNLSPVVGDRVQLQQVVLNLVMNAIQAMSSVEERPRELIISTRNIDADCVQATVEDSGTGIAPAIADKIFDSFYTTKPSGMGMGLSISRSILQSHGGRLWTEGKQAPGTMFHFTVPKYDNEVARGQAART